MIALVAVLAFSVMAGCGKREAGTADKDTSKVIATYEGGEITENEFDLEQRMILVLQPQMEQLIQMEDFREFLIKQEIAYEYLADKADKKTKEAGKKKADEQLKEMKAAYGDDSFKQMLDSQKVAEAEFVNYMTRIFTVMEGEQQKVTEDEVKNEFEATKENYTTASVRHILIGFTDKEGKERSQEDALKLANEVKGKLDKGEDFATLVKEYSGDGQQNIDNGGLYADAPVSQWVPEFKEAALTQPLNEVGEPVQTQYGYHIVRVEKRTEKTYDALNEEEKEMIKTTLAAGKLDEFMAGDLEKSIIKKIELPPVKTDEGTEAGTGTDAGSNGGTNAGTDGSGNAGTDGANSGVEDEGNSSNAGK